MQTVLTNGFSEMSQDEMNIIAGGAWEWNEFNEAVIKGSISGAVVGGVDYTLDVIW